MNTTPGAPTDAQIIEAADLNSSYSDEEALAVGRRILSLHPAPSAALAAPVASPEPVASDKQQKTLRSIRAFLSSEYSKDATTAAKIARQRQIGALLDSMDRMQK